MRRICSRCHSPWLDTFYADLRRGSLRKGWYFRATLLGTGGVNQHHESKRKNSIACVPVRDNTHVYHCRESMRTGLVRHALLRDTARDHLRRELPHSCSHAHRARATRLPTTTSSRTLRPETQDVFYGLCSSFASSFPFLVHGLSSLGDLRPTFAKRTRRGSLDEYTAWKNFFAKTSFIRHYPR